MSYQNLVMLFNTIPSLEDDEDEDNGDGTYKSTKKKKDDEEVISVVDMAEWRMKKTKENRRRKK